MPAQLEEVVAYPDPLSLEHLGPDTGQGRFQFAARVQKVLQLNVPLRAMFECSTVEELATYVEGLKASELSDDKVDRLSDLMAELEAL